MTTNIAAIYDGSPLFEKGNVSEKKKTDKKQKFEAGGKELR